MRSASYSFSLVKLICCCIASACVPAMAADVAWPLFAPPTFDARTASASPAIVVRSASCWLTSRG